MPTPRHCHTFQSADLIQIIPFSLVSLLNKLWCHYHICFMSNATILVSLWKSPLHFLPSSLPLSGTVKDRDRELIQQHVWCIFKQLWSFFFFFPPSFQPTEDLICYNLISGQNHTAYLSNIKHPQFSLAGHLAGEWGRKKKEQILFYFLRIFAHLHFFIWHLKEALICQVITSSFLKKERMFKCG